MNISFWPISLKISKSYTQENCPSCYHLDLAGDGDLAGDLAGDLDREREYERRFLCERDLERDLERDRLGDLDLERRSSGDSYNAIL